MRKTQFRLILLVVYVLMQFCWWAYMLINLNEEVFQHKIELAKYRVESGLEQQDVLKDLDKKLNLRFWMVAGEGSVFLTLLLFGISRLMIAYNKEMELARQQKNFLLSITHEFKSPLAAVKLNMQTMQRHHLDEEKQKMIVNSTIKEANRLNNLVENALTAAQIDTHNYHLTKEKFNLSECIKTNLQTRSIASDKIKRVKAQVEDDIYITGDCSAATSIVLNLLENAEKYTGNDAEISLSLHKKNKEVELLVADNGIGIADAEKPKVFEKFYRVGNEDTRKSKGTGLGLYIVKKLVELHHGKISVHDNVPKGTVFQVTFTV